jgi:sodium-dependent dicarboxylate transporter 2/3/5
MKKIGLFLAPIAFTILLFIPNPKVMSPEAWKVIAVAVFMLIWWVTEAVPLAVTALLPIILLPFVDVMPIKQAAAPYSSPIVFLFMGGFMIALAMERWHLHRRIALFIVKLTGTNANGIILGFMLATVALSMWISNTATTIMMLPIALSVIQLLTSNNDDFDKKGIRNFSLAMMLGIAYSANVGGTATIIGTPPNTVLAGFIEETYKTEIGFANWFIVGFPFMLVMLALMYLFIVKILFPNRLGSFNQAQNLIETEYQKLGKISKGERLTLMVFLSTALLWILRTTINNLIPGLSLTDAGIAMLASIALFVVPVNFKKEAFLLEWKNTEKLPWGILLLFGGGLSLAGALSQTGLIDLIGAQFVSNDNIGFWVILGLTAVSLFMTEVMSNVALVAVLLPVLAGIAQGLGIEPMHLMAPVTLAASCAFMLPMSTPPNAIVFASGHLKVADMVRAGFLLNILAIILISLLAYFVMPLVF